MSESLRAEPIMPRVADGTGRQLLAAVRAHPRELTPQFEFLDWCGEHEGVVREALGMALGCEPWLSADGLGHVAQWLPREGRSETADEALARFERARAVLADSPGQFARALCYLHTRAARRTPDRGARQLPLEARRRAALRGRGPARPDVRQQRRAGGGGHRGGVLVGAGPVVAERGPQHQPQGAAGMSETHAPPLSEAGWQTLVMLLDCERVTCHAGTGALRLVLGEFEEVEPPEGAFDELVAGGFVDLTDLPDHTVLLAVTGKGRYHAERAWRRYDRARRKKGG
ncbi:MAG: hypothetical protein K2V38_05445 [Gemmataceae bacterium]|nr:hypothetical protein [Gemmataceae bacterium]